MTNLLNFLNEKLLSFLNTNAMYLYDRIARTNQILLVINKGEEEEKETLNECEILPRIYMQ